MAVLEQSAGELPLLQFSDLHPGFFLEWVNEVLGRHRAALQAVETIQMEEKRMILIMEKTEHTTIFQAEVPLLLQ